MTRAKKNTCTIYSQDGMLRIRFRYQGKLIRKALGLPDLPIHKVKAQQIASTIELAILSDTFDLESLDDYVFNKPTAIIDTKVKPSSTRKSGRHYKNSPKRQPFTKDEIKLILDAFYSDRFTSKYSAYKDSYYAQYFHALFLLGCRISELIGLTWQDVDFNKNEIRITKALARSQDGKTSSKHRSYKDPKTKAGIRTIPMNSQIRDLFSGINQRKPEDLVFPSPKGLCLDDHNVLRIWKKIINGLGIEYRVPYAIRHTRATNLIESGKLPINQVSYILGHANSQITLTTYVHNRKPESLPDL